jgi:signal transduction histidine kinase
MAGEINDEQREQLSLVKSSGDHLLSLINDILDISKIEAGKVELYFEEFSPVDVITEVIDTLSPLAGLKGIEITSGPIPDAKLYSDRRRFKQILMNLAGNAVKFTEQGSVTIVTDYPDTDRLRVRVIDTGIGIKEEDLDMLFAAFQQINGSLTRRYQGSGLGLHLSNKLSVLLGGNISVHSVFGEGSEFTVTIPLKYPEDQKNEESTGS